MKDGRTHMAHKAEHAVDLETGAVVGVTFQAADAGDTQTMIETLVTAAEQVDLTMSIMIPRHNHLFNFEIGSTQNKESASMKH